jgi:hypothetical protein
MFKHAFCLNYKKQAKKVQIIGPIDLFIAVLDFPDFVDCPKL